MPNPGRVEQSHTNVGCPRWTRIESDPPTSAMQRWFASGLTAWSVYKEEVNDRYQPADFPNTSLQTRPANPSPGPTKWLDVSKPHC